MLKVIEIVQNMKFYRRLGAVMTKNVFAQTIPEKISATK